MLMHLHVRRIRSILDAKIPLAPMTVIVGPNGSGKSNIIGAIVLCSRTARRLLRARGVASTRNTSRVEVTLPFEPFSREEVYAYTSNPDTLVELSTLSSLAPFRNRFQMRYSMSPPDAGVVCRCMLGVPGTPVALLREIADIRYISTDRLIQPDTRLEATEKEEEALIAMLARIGRDPAKVAELDRMGEYFGVDWTYPLKDLQELEFIDLKIAKGVKLPFRLASLGTRQFLPILLHTLDAEQGAVFLTEEPEISLHPSVQVAIGEYFGKSVARGIQLIMTTHSHYLLAGLCKEVRDGRLNEFFIIQ
jgi:ABC-type ATPase involved in cell division